MPYRTSARPARRRSWLSRLLCSIGLHRGLEVRGDDLDRCEVWYPCCGRVIKRADEPPHVLGDRLSIRGCFRVVDKLRR